MTTTNNILTEVWNIVSSSPISALSGGIYKNTRPTDSALEDCIISMFPGVSGKFLCDGQISIKIFYKDLFSNNTYVEDSLKGQAMEGLLNDLSLILLTNNTIIFYVESREGYTAPVNEIHQHYAILKMKFKLIN